MFVSESGSKICYPTSLILPALPAAGRNHGTAWWVYKHAQSHVAPAQWAWAWGFSGFFCDSSSCCWRQLALKKSCRELVLALSAAFNTARAYLLGYIRVPHPTDYAAKHGMLFSCWGVSSSVCHFFFLLLFLLVLRLPGAVQSRAWVRCFHPCMSGMHPESWAAKCWNRNHKIWNLFQAAERGLAVPMIFNICLSWVSRHQRQPPVPAHPLPGWAAWTRLPDRLLGHPAAIVFLGGWRNQSPPRSRRKPHHVIFLWFVQRPSRPGFLAAATVSFVQGIGSLFLLQSGRKGKTCVTGTCVYQCIEKKLVGTKIVSDTCPGP